MGMFGRTASQHTFSGGFGFGIAFVGMDMLFLSTSVCWLFGFIIALVLNYAFLIALVGMLMTGFIRFMVADKVLMIAVATGIMLMLFDFRKLADHPAVLVAAVVGMAMQHIIRHTAKNYALVDIPVLVGPKAGILVFMRDELTDQQLFGPDPCLSLTHKSIKRPSRHHQCQAERH